MTNQEKAKFLADQCRPCTEDFYSGFLQGAQTVLDAEFPEPNKGLSGDLEHISEQAAGSLIEIINSFASQTAFFSKTIEQYSEQVVNISKQKIFNKFLVCAVRYGKSSFITRWYHKRKYLKAKDDMIRFCVAFPDVRFDNIKNEKD